MFSRRQEPWEALLKATGWGRGRIDTQALWSREGHLAGGHCVPISVCQTLKVCFPTHALL